MTNWYINKDCSPKTHRRPRTCECCRDNPKSGGCALPFRKTIKVRTIKAANNKPEFFKGLAMSNFLKMLGR